MTKREPWSADKVRWSCVSDGQKFPGCGRCGPCVDALTAGWRVLSASDAGATRAEDDVARDLDLEAIERRARELWSARFHEDMRGYPWQQHNGVPSPFRSWAHEQAYRAALAVSSRAPSPPAPADEPECCASGRCEVCTPGFVWGRNG